MGIFADFREVLTGMTRKKRGEATINLCPRCGSPEISFCRGFDAYPRLDGIIPRKYVCTECGYKGPIVLEGEKEETS
jgi:C4-type Zn-finger protein